MSRRLLLITGIPGTGKTAMGEYLEAHHSFLHVNREINQPPAFSVDPKGFVAASGQDIVATWGFRPGVHCVQELRQLGFVGIWLDGFRPWALRQFLAAKPEKESEFYLQMLNITSTEIIATLGFPIVNPFTPDGVFRSKPAIAAELLAYLP